MLSKVKLIGKSFKEAVEIIGQQAELDGYLQAGENEIVVTTTDENNDQYELIELSTISTPRTIHITDLSKWKILFATP